MSAPPVITGATVSTIVNVALVVMEFPQASLAVKVTFTEPVSPQSSLSELKLLDQVTSPQPSVAEAPPLEASQSLRSVKLPVPSHSTDRSFAPLSKVGGIRSKIVNKAVVELWLPHSSVAVKETRYLAVSPQVS